MKGIIIIILILLAACYFMLRMGTETDPQPSERPVARPQVQPAPAQAQQQESKPRQKGAIESIVDYGTGYTPLKVGQKSRDKIQNISEERNKQLEEALGQ